MYYLLKWIKFSVYELRKQNLEKILEQWEKILVSLVGKYWKTRGISEKCYLLFFSDINMNYVLFAKWIKFSVYELRKQNIEKILEQWEKNTAKVREFC